MVVAGARAKGMSVSEAAREIAKIEIGQKVKKPDKDAVKKCKRQIENDCAALTDAYKLHAEFLGRNIAAGHSSEEFQAKLDALAAGDAAVECEVAAIYLGTIAPRKKSHHKNS